MLRDVSLRAILRPFCVMLNHFGFDTRLRRGGPSWPEELVGRTGLGPDAPAMQRPLSPFLCMSLMLILPVRLPLSGCLRVAVARCGSLWLDVARFRFGSFPVCPPNLTRLSHSWGIILPTCCTLRCIDASHTSRLSCTC